MYEIYLKTFITGSALSLQLSQCFPRFYQIQQEGCTIMNSFG